MAKEEAERLLIDGGSDKKLRLKYDQTEDMESFVALAAEDGYDFTPEELLAVLQGAGDTFESQGNPRCRQIWWS
jgi:hypothetical protein